MKKIIKEALALFLITLVAGILLGLVYRITKDPIRKQEEKTKLDAYRNIFSGLDSTKSISEEEINSAQEDVLLQGYKHVTVNEIVKAYNSAEEYLGLIITVTDSNGYGGNIRMTVGIDISGTIMGLEFLEINETAGLGMKAKEYAFRKQFIGMNTEYVRYSKTGAAEPDEFDAISSATITSNAVCEGVNGALISFRKVMGMDNE